MHPRNSRDYGEANNFGHTLINLWCNFYIHFANGRSRSDPHWNYTCITPNGCSVVDYILVSSRIFYNILDDFEVIPYDSESNHFPLNIIVDIFQSAAQCTMNISIKHRSSKQRPTWWDMECDTAKSKKNSLLLTFRKCKTNEGTQWYVVENYGEGPTWYSCM